MSFLEQELSHRNLPPIFQVWPADCFETAWEQRKKELFRLLEDNLYGKTPPPPQAVEAQLLEKREESLAGNVSMEKLLLSFDTPKGRFSFPFHLFVPKTIEKPPVFLHISFHREIFSPYLPLEEITDQGFAVAFFCYHDVVQDTCDSDYCNGLAGMFQHAGPRLPNEWGKIGMWAYGASRMMDYLCQREDLDAAHISVVGHSRLGKTALWCMAQDNRFYAGISNNSGFGGAALAKGGTGEKVRDFLDWGSCDWFCPTFRGFENKEDVLPYDQHFLLALCAPRHVYVASASKDNSADPKSEFLSCYAASAVYSGLGRKGLVTQDDYPQVGDSLQTGDVGYHLRPGVHYLSRYDWNQYIRFIRQKMAEETSE